MTQAFDLIPAVEKNVNYAWQYHGYPALSAWMGSANDFFVLRRFSPLQARCLLYLQHEIARRQESIEAWDQYAMKRPMKTGQNGSLSHDPFPDRIALIKEVTPLLQQYSEYKSLSEKS